MSSSNESRVRDPARRERILSAATILIAEKGYNQVSLTDIGGAAGIVGSGIYRHFNNKVSILTALLDQVVDRLIANAEHSLATSDRPAAVLSSLVRGQIDFTIGERELCQVYLREQASLPDRDLRRLRWKQRHYIDLWQEVHMSVHPHITPEQSEVLIHAAVSAIHSVLRYRPTLAERDLATLLEGTACSMLGVSVNNGYPHLDGAATADGRQMVMHATNASAVKIRPALREARSSTEEFDDDHDDDTASSPPSHGVQ